MVVNMLFSLTIANSNFAWLFRTKHKNKTIFMYSKIYVETTSALFFLPVYQNISTYKISHDSLLLLILLNVTEFVVFLWCVFYLFH